jgi:glutamine amidotransferase
MITIIDYGLGNVRAFVNVYERLNIKTKIARSANDITGATRLILPGVGAFDYAMTRLDQSGMRSELERQVLQNNVPVLGICVGMQILSKSSEEGLLPGLGWIDGHVKRFDVSEIPFKIHLPHMGWNTIKPERENQLLNGLDDESRFYFLHSYYFICTHPSETIATAEYGLRYACAVNKENIFGVQFHPEKSHGWGIRLLRNFAEISIV